MRLAALFSGGKDSAFAVLDSMRKGHEIKHLVTIASKNSESYMFHYPNIKFTKYQAEAMGIPQIIRESSGEKEKELQDLKQALADIRGDIDGVVCGGLASNYQYDRIKLIAKQLGLQVVVPFWRIEPERYWELMLSAGFEVMIIGVACDGLGKEWLGRIIDRNAFWELRKLSQQYRFHLAFEGGEAETFVINCPIFRKRLVPEGDVYWENDSGFYLFRNVNLV
jgi:diphthine-ammonia ligase